MPAADVVLGVEVVGRVRRRGLFVASMVVMLGYPAGNLPARADAFAYGCDTWGSGNEPCRQDNAGVVWCHAASLNGFADLKAATSWAIDAIVGPTDLTASLASACSPTTDDITFRRQDLGDDTLGATWCTDPDTTADRCGAATVATDFGTQQYAIDDPYGQVPYSNGTASDGELLRNLRANWCHEAGHSVGLEHHPALVTDRDQYYDGSAADREQDCMVSGHIEFDQQWMRVNAHHRAHINAAY